MLHDKPVGHEQKEFQIFKLYKTIFIFAITLFIILNIIFYFFISKDIQITEKIINDVKMNKLANRKYLYNNLKLSKKDTLKINNNIIFDKKNLKVYYKSQNFLFEIQHYVILFLTINLIILSLFVLFYFIFKKSFDKLMKINETLFEINFKNKKDSLSNKMIINIAENLHHELKTPIMSLKSIVYEYNDILNTIKNILNSSNKEKIIQDLKLIFYGDKKLVDKCNYCGENCDKFVKEYYDFYNKNLNDYSEELKKLSDLTLKNMFNTLKITKDLKSFKYNTKEIAIYDVIEHAVKIYLMIQKYKFNYKIDPRLKYCYLNGLGPDVLINIILNHVSNSLEAQSNYISFELNEYFKKNNRNFISFYIIDNGTGIPEDKQPFIYKLNFSTKINSEEPRGFGLYLCKQLLNYYKGDEKLIYSDKDGTIFELIIPVKYCNGEKIKERRRNNHAQIISSSTR